MRVTKTVQNKDRTMKIKVNTVETRTGPKAGKFTFANVDVIRNDGSVIANRTLMAFGKPRDAIKGFMKAGRTVTILAKFQGGTILALGADKAKVAAKAAAAA
jgi:hypothetical protein